MRTTIIALAAFSILAAPAQADRGRTGRGADSDGDRNGERHRAMLQDARSEAAILILRALIDQLVEEGVLPRESALKVLDRAKAISAAEAQARHPRLREERELDGFKQWLER
jgi:hypothetical protein